MSTSIWPQELSWFSGRLEQNRRDNLDLSTPQIEALHRHFVLLGRWNPKLNLTSIRSPEEAVVRHYCESLFFAAHLSCAAGASIADIGAGAGFPGIPLAIALPECRVSLVESHQRKSVFLREAGRELNNVSVVSSRAETVSGYFDWMVSRAVDPFAVVELAPRLSNRIGLMIGEGDAVQLRRSPEFRIDSEVPLPWGERRVCVYGVALP